MCAGGRGGGGDRQRTTIITETLTPVSLINKHRILLGGGDAKCQVPNANALQQKHFELFGCL